MAAFATIPYIRFSIRAPGEYFPWIFLMVSFLGFYLWFIPAPMIVRIVSTGAFFNALMSTAPLVSFIAYISLIGCCYFYLLVYSIKNFTPVFKILYAMLILHSAMFLAQAFGVDTLLNYNNNMTFGIVGQYMQSASFIVILTAALLPFNRFTSIFSLIISLICNSTGAFLSTALGIAVYFRKNKKYIEWLFLGLVPAALAWIWIGGDFSTNTSLEAGRMAVWVKTFQLSMQHPFVGWGAGTFQYIFPAICGLGTMIWKTAHNCWLQILFECGAAGFGIVFGYFVYLSVSLWRLIRRSLFKCQATACLSGLVMIASNMCYHFPTRMIQSVLIIIFFLAYCQRVVDNAKQQS